MVADDAGYVDAALFGHELVYFRSEHIENAEASRALAAWLLVHDINSELHPLTVDVQGYDRSAFWDAIKIVRESDLGASVSHATSLPRPSPFGPS